MNPYTSLLQRVDLVKQFCQSQVDILKLCYIQRTVFNSKLSLPENDCDPWLDSPVVPVM